MNRSIGLVTAIGEATRRGPCGAALSPPTFWSRRPTTSHHTTLDPHIQACFWSGALAIRLRVEATCCSSWLCRSFCTIAHPLFGLFCRCTCTWLRFGLRESRIVSPDLIAKLKFLAAGTSSFPALHPRQSSGWRHMKSDRPDDRLRTLSHAETIAHP